MCSRYSLRTAWVTASLLRAPIRDAKQSRQAWPDRISDFHRGALVSWHQQRADDAAAALRYRATVLEASFQVVGSRWHLVPHFPISTHFTCIQSTTLPIARFRGSMLAETT